VAFSLSKQEARVVNFTITALQGFTPAGGYLNVAVIGVGRCAVSSIRVEDISPIVEHFTLT
jgi:hypothetical protein